ncbi:MAG: type II toxin-antitoxin system RelE/ParE family toxin [Verrucomicrobiia bacterium]
MKPLLVHPLAKAELDGAIAYYESKVSGLGLDFLASVEQAFRKIQQSPQAWPSHVDPRFRKYLVERFPYSIFYMQRPNAIWIAAIAHAKRRPDYWKQRAEPK